MLYYQGGLSLKEAILESKNLEYRAYCVFIIVSTVKTSESGELISPTWVSEP